MARAARVDSSRLGLESGDRFGAALAVLRVKSQDGSDSLPDLDGSAATLDIAVGAPRVDSPDVGVPISSLFLSTSFFFF